MQWSVIFNKELVEHWRNFKWIWVPIVFILFCIMDPLTTYYMPVILESLGGLPEGAVFEIPMPSPAEAFMMSIAQLNSIGILIIAVISMGLISGEVRSGVYEIVMSKPVKYSNYVTAKFSAMFLLVLIALVFGLLASWYYVQLLFGSLSLTQVLVVMLFYAVWLGFVLSLIIFFNTLFRSPGVIAFITIILVIVLSILSDIFTDVLAWSPARMADYISIYMYTGDLDPGIWWTTIISIGLAAIFIIVGINLLRRRAIA